ncbi:MAG: hypothetical protein U9O54_07070 [Chloroflexota bacterium]|nr:hypothetical protein [Chloroflexota bacterium]
MTQMCQKYTGLADLRGFKPFLSFLPQARLWRSAFIRHIREAAGPSAFYFATSTKVSGS